MPTQPSIAVIEFASPAMLGWAAAAALPWLVNLWIRRRHVETQWAAMELLVAAVRERSRRLQLRELMLLALRTAILLLAALAAARPTWYPTESGASVAGRVHEVLVIDQSMSMGCRVPEGTRLEIAKRHAAEMVNAATTGDAVSVIGWGNSAEDVLGRPTFAPLDAGRAIGSLEQLDTVADLSSALRAAAAAVERGLKELPELTPRVVFVSDGQMTTWAAREGSALEDVEQGDVVEQWQSLGKKTEIVVVNVDQVQCSNVAICDIRFEPTAPTLNELASVTVELAGFGPSPVPRATVELQIDGRRVDVREAALRAGEKSVVSFDAQFAHAGQHIVHARLKAEGDPLEADNHRWLALEVTSPLRAICFADERRQAIDVARSLNPRFDQATTEGRIVAVIAETGSVGSTALSDFQAVFLCNVAELSQREQRLLRTYVEAGGALVIVLGDRVRPGMYNEFLRGGDDANRSNRALLPITIADSPVEGEWRIDPLGYAHPIAAPFAGHARAGLLSVRISRYFPIYRASKPTSVEIPLGVSAGDPLLVAGDAGDGRVAVVATSPALATVGEPWSSLAVSPSFVPLMRELLQHVTAQRHAALMNRLAGGTLPSVDGAEWRSAEGTSVRSAGEPRRAGVYRLTRGTPATSAASDSGGRPAPVVAVNVSPRESDLTAIDAADLMNESAAAGGRLQVAGGSHISGAPLAGRLVAGVGLLLVAELTVAWLLGRGAA